MELMLGWISQLSGVIRPHIIELSTVIVMTLLVVYGNEINRSVKNLIRRQHFLFRYLIFILLCCFGYGALLLLLAPFIATQLAALSATWLAPVVILLFVIVGILADRKNQF